MNQNTQAHIYELIASVNTILEKHQSPYRIVYKGAYGGVGLDRALAGSEHSGVEESLTGYITKRELVQYLNAMLKALYMVEGER
jgi:hypothetical protein